MLTVRHRNHKVQEYSRSDFEFYTYTYTVMSFVLCSVHDTRNIFRNISMLPFCEGFSTGHYLVCGLGLTLKSELPG